MRALLNLVRTWWIAITLLNLVTITTLSLRPLESLPDLPVGDKIRHLIAYAGLMFPVALRKPRCWLLIGLCFIVWSGCIELIQPYVNRYGEWQDLVANSAGVILGGLTALMFHAVFLLKPEDENQETDPN